MMHEDRRGSRLTDRRAEGGMKGLRGMKGGRKRGGGPDLVDVGDDDVLHVLDLLLHL